MLVLPFPPSNTVMFPKFMCSNAFTCSPAISFHWSTILYWIAIAGFDSAALTIASKPSASASNDFFLPSASASNFNWIALASASACARVAFARASASRVIFSAIAFACRIASCRAISAGTIFSAFSEDSTFWLSLLLLLSEQFHGQPVRQLPIWQQLHRLVCQRWLVSRLVRSLKERLPFVLHFAR